MKKKKKIKWKTLIPIYAMMLPGLIYLLINNYAPMFGLVIAFKRIDWGKGILKSDWVGFSNFSYLFSSDEAWTMTRNTIGYNILFIVIGTTVAIMVAIFMNEITSKFANRIYQTLILLPYMISWVVCGYLVNALLSSETGLINLGILSKLGIEPIVWYQEKKYWPFIILLVYIWKKHRFFDGYLSGKHCRNQQGILRSGKNRWSEEVETDPLHHPSAPQADDHHPADHEHWKHFLLRLRTVLSDSEKLRSPVRCDPDH